ncbi:hypothetical protein [Halonotius pteroides]|uniref:hypothetical protein n=1 Tax=Halonotius pteroides TaxID=268735 RepID=UPI001403FB7F|nr:hypothetical protein [Halonotius pteroides]
MDDPLLQPEGCRDKIHLDGRTQMRDELANVSSLICPLLLEVLAKADDNRLICLN